MQIFYLLENKSKNLSSFFMDDYLVYVEAFLDQVHLIKQCLQVFCESSSQKVKDSKMKAFFSRNVNHIHAQELSLALGFSLMNDLGKYLGVPFLHQRVKKETYGHLLTSLEKRLSGQKVSTLFFIDRLTLTKVVGWHEVCKQKLKYGLGLWHLQSTNLAFMINIGWGLIKKKDELWAHVLRAKYGYGVSYMLRISEKRNCSNVWKGVVKAQPYLKNGVAWNFGNGWDMYFQTNKWILNLNFFG